MRRELKDEKLCKRLQGVQSVTRHIPMRRELKGYSLIFPSMPDPSHKAYPDEKGTESLSDIA